jgi:hypothetical protein
MKLVGASLSPWAPPCYPQTALHKDSWVRHRSQKTFLASVSSSLCNLRTPRIVLGTHRGTPPHLIPTHTLAAQVRVEELKNRLVSANLIDLLGEAVALVIEDNILDRHAALLNRFNDLV